MRFGPGRPDDDARASRGRAPRRHRGTFPRARRRVAADGVRPGAAARTPILHGAFDARDAWICRIEIRWSGSVTTPGGGDSSGRGRIRADAAAVHTDLLGRRLP